MFSRNIYRNIHIEEIDENKENLEKLREAIYGSNVEAVKSLITFPVDVNTKDFRNMTLIMFACEKSDDPDIISLLINQPNANLNILDENEETCLYHACRKGNPSIVNLLLKKGANPNIGNSPLKLAVINNNKNIVENILQSDISIDKVTECLYSTPSEDVLSIMLDFLIDKNIKIDEIVDKTGRPILHYNAMYGSIEIVKLLIKKGANVNLVADSEDEQIQNNLEIYGTTPIQLALFNHEKGFELIQLLLKNGAFLNLWVDKGHFQWYNSVELAYKNIINLNQDNNISQETKFFLKFTYAFLKKDYKEVGDLTTEQIEEFTKLSLTIEPKYNKELIPEYANQLSKLNEFLKSTNNLSYQFVIKELEEYLANQDLENIKQLNVLLNSSALNINSIDGAISLNNPLPNNDETKHLGDNSLTEIANLSNNA
ncbi:MAG: ankyrin repeat domain-containing protein [Rickettsia endosymbiont of Glossina mortisans submortisans]|nr:ankyrin repeat domain-containing protein [Rickettsia endosymbiont of Glossina mortisans submortisans]